MTVAIATLGATNAAAQSKGRVAVGAGFTGRQAVDDASNGSKGIGFIWRLGQSKEGWKYKYGLNWYSTQLDRVIDDTTTDFGKLTVRPIMGGYGYTHLMGRASVSTGVLGGYAFTKFQFNSVAEDRYRTALGATTVAADVANTFVLKPEVSAWFNVNEKIGVNISTGYMLARPLVTLKTPAGNDRRRVKADTMILKIGVVYSVF